jgi:cell division protein FtsB
MRTIIGSKPDTTVEQMAHVALTSLCESCLAATAVMSITLFPIRNQENPMWKQRLKAVSDLEGPHLNADMAAMVKYTQYLFNLQHNTARTVMQQRMRLTAYDEHNTAISRELEQLKHENALLHSGTLPPSDQDHNLKVVYHHLSEAEHGWNMRSYSLSTPTSSKTSRSRRGQQ